MIGEPIRYLDVCAGYSAVTVAWEGLPFQCVGYSEIEPFPRAMLEQRHGAVAVDWDHRFAEGCDFTPLFGDFTKIEAHHVGPVDLLAGGTPCQAFSLAGLRGGLGDARGNLTLEFLRLAQRVRAPWILWENVRGVFSATAHDAPDCRPPDIDLDAGHGPGDGEEIVVEDRYEADESHALSCFLAGLSELGYGWAYRVLDAQYVRVDGLPRAVPQRRCRVFVVGHLGDAAGPAAVLFDRESLRGDPAPRREAGQGTAPTLSARTQGGGGLGTDFDCDGGLVAATLDASYGHLQGASGQDLNHGHSHLVAFGGNRTGGATDVSTALNAHGGPAGRLDFESETFVMQAGVTRENPASGPDGIGVQKDVAYTLEARPEVQIVASAYRITPNDGAYEQGDIVASLTTGSDPSANVITIPIDMRQASRGDKMTNNRPEGSSGGAPGTGIGEDGDPSPCLGTDRPPAVAYSIMPQNSGKDYKAREVDVAQPLMAGGPVGGNQGGDFVAEPVAFSLRGRDGEPQAEPAEDGLAPSLRAMGGGSSHAFLAQDWAVRRLTPTECERLMGVPDGFTAITYRGKPAADGPRYKVLGNSQAINQQRFNGHGLAAVITAQRTAGMAA